MDDYYKILGVSKNASEDEIKKAFRRLAHTYHPDKQGGDEKKFKEINEAYQVLSNKEKRAQYDRFGKTFNGAGQQGFGGFDFGDIFSGFSKGGYGSSFQGDFSDMFGGAEDIGDIFGNIFGGGSHSSKRKRGMDIQADINIKLEDAFSGIKKSVSFKTFVKCDKCNGIGHEKSSGTVTCDVCKGSGKIRQQRNSFIGSFVQIQECQKCNGKGQIPKNICHECKGTGRVIGNKTADIDIKSGVQNGQIIKIAEFGEAGVEGHPAGDLYIRIIIEKHKTFSVEGDNLIIEKNIKMSDILTEKEFEISGINGNKIKFNIPSGYMLDNNIVISGEGMPKSSSMSFGSKKRGDLIVVLKVKTPKKINSKAKKLAEELADELDE